MEDLVDLQLTNRGYGRVDFNAPKPETNKLYFTTEKPKWHLLNQ